MRALLLPARCSPGCVSPAEDARPSPSPGARPRPSARLRGGSRLSLRTAPATGLLWKNGRRLLAASLELAAFAVRVPLDDEVHGVTYLREYSSHMDTLSFSDACLLAYDNNVSSHYVYQVRAVALLNESQYLSGNILRHDINWRVGQFSRPADEWSSHFPWHPPLSLDRYFEDAIYGLGRTTLGLAPFDTSDNFRHSLDPRRLFSFRLMHRTSILFQTFLFSRK